MSLDSFQDLLLYKPDGSRSRKDYLQIIREGLISGASEESAPVPPEQRLVITDLIIPAGSKACNIMVKRYPDSP